MIVFGPVYLQFFQLSMLRAMVYHETGIRVPCSDEIEKYRRRNRKFNVMLVRIRRNNFFTRIHRIDNTYSLKMIFISQQVNLLQPKARNDKEMFVFYG